MAQKFVNVILYPSIDFLGTEGIWFEMLETEDLRNQYCFVFLREKVLLAAKASKIYNAMYNLCRHHHFCFYLKYLVLNEAASLQSNNLR